MRVLWTEPAVADLEAIVLYIRLDNGPAAEKIAQTIFREIQLLSSMSFRGRPGVVPGTRELVFTPLPYIAVYEILGSEVRILRIRHAAQDWP